MGTDGGMRFRGWPEDRAENGKRRAFEERWRNTGKARVVHPNHRSVIVPCGSCFSSVLCAADVWNVPWYTVMDAVVQLCDQNLPVENRPKIYR